MMLYNKENPPLMSKVFRKFWDALYTSTTYLPSCCLVLWHTSPVFGQTVKILTNALMCLCSQCALMSPQINQQHFNSKFLLSATCHSNYYVDQSPAFVLISWESKKICCFHERFSDFLMISSEYINKSRGSV